MNELELLSSLKMPVLEKIEKPPELKLPGFNSFPKKKKKKIGTYELR